MCCLVDAAERGASLEEFALEADVFFAPVASELPATVEFEEAREPPPELLLELLRCVDAPDSPLNVEFDALDVPSLDEPRVDPVVEPLAPLLVLPPALLDFASDFASDFTSDFASDFASDFTPEFASAAPALAPEVSCEADCADCRSASAALV